MDSATQPTERWVPARVGSPILGIAPRTLSLLASRGFIRYRLLPGMRVKLFNVADLEKIAASSIREPVHAGRPD